MQLQQVLSTMPLIAILRHITPDEIPQMADAILKSGIICIEVPLNSPDALRSIKMLSDNYAQRALIGAGTVLSTDDVDNVAESGGKIIIMPHCDTKVIHRAKELDLICMPGVATATEAFAALEAGADALKLFPAEAVTPQVTKALRAVLPKDIALIPTGGITPEKIPEYLSAGANGFGLGSALYTPGHKPSQVESSAKAFTSTLK